MTVFPKGPIIGPARSASINEQFNLEQRKDLFSAGLGAVSLLQSMARLYLKRSPHHLSAAQTTLPFLITFPLFFSIAVLQLRPFFSNVSSYHWIAHFNQRFPPSFTSRREFYYDRNIPQRESCSASWNDVVFGQRCHITGSFCKGWERWSPVFKPSNSKKTHYNQAARI